MDDFIEKEAPLSAIIFDYYLNFIPFFANLFSCLFTFIAVIYFTSRMAFNTEIIAMLSSGVSFNRLLVPYFISALIIAIFSFVLNSFIIPPANKVRLEFEDTYIRNPYRNYDRDIHKQIKPGTYIYMENYNSMYDIGYKFSIEHFENGLLKSKLMSDYIKWDTTTNKWVVNNYYIRYIEEMNERIETGRKIDTVLGITPADFKRRENVVEKMNYFQLNEFIDEQIMQGADNIVPYLIEKYRRISIPFASFILTLIGVSVASRKVKGGIGLHIGIGILISFAYILFMQFSTVFAVSGNVNPMLAVWIPNIFFAIISIFLYRITPK